MVVGITIYLLVGVVPKFQGMFDSLGAELPPLTQVVINLSNWMQENVSMVFVGMAVAFGLYKLIGRTRDGQRILDQITLRLPVFGQLGQKVAVISLFPYLCNVAVFWCADSWRARDRGKYSR